MSKIVKYVLDKKGKKKSYIEFSKTVFPGLLHKKRWNTVTNVPKTHTLHSVHASFVDKSRLKIIL